MPLNAEPSALQGQLHHVRIRMVVIVNLAFLVYSVATTLVGPNPVSWFALLEGVHRNRTFATLMALAGLAAIWRWPHRVQSVYTPYLAILLLVSVVETSNLISQGTVPFHLALWLSVNMAVLFLVYGARRGLIAFGLTLGTVLLTLLVNMPFGGYLLADWITTLIVMTVSGATSFLLTTLIESHMLLNERAISELRSARIDALTGVYGRAAIEDVLGQLFGATRQKGEPLSVIVGDLDRFKAINDAHGHSVGDGVLRAFGERLREVVDPQGGVVGRWGGEEFLIVLPRHTLAQARALAERLCEHTSRRPLGELPVTASFGVASEHPAQTGPSQLFTEADQAMYEAKRTGRNRVCVGAPGL